MAVIRALTAITALCAGAWSAGCASSIDYVTGRATLNAYELQEDVELGTKMATLLIASAETLGVRVDPDDLYTRTIRTVAARILAVPENRARMPPISWEVHVLGAADADAWCFPGGRVVVSSGLLQSGLVRDEDELAALLGHEFAHAAARHGTERRTVEELRRRIAPFGSFFGARLVELANPRTPREVIDALGEDGSNFDRAQEIEADLIGLEMMARAGYAPEKAAEVWARIARARGEGAGLLSTHPAFAERARELSRHVAAARFVAARRHPAEQPAKSGTGWTWSEDQLGLPAPKTSLRGEGSLPEGVNAPEYVAAGALLTVSAAIEGGRAKIGVAAGRDLFEDTLWLTVSLASEGTKVFQTIDVRPLRAPKVVVEAEAAEKLRVRAEVGAIFATDE